MYDSYDVDPILIMMRSRQQELIKEADFYHLASEAKHKLGRDGFPIQRMDKK
jgi:hypothetical protein